VPSWVRVERAPGSAVSVGWPASRDELVAVQRELAKRTAPELELSGPGLLVGACFACFSRGRSESGTKDEPGWAAAVLTRNRKLIESVVVTGTIGAPYEPGLLALREGALLAGVLRRLPLPEVLLVDATGRDHPRRAGLALHLGAVLDVATVGITSRPLIADGEWPENERGSSSPILLDSEIVGYWLRSRAGARPIVVHAGWGTDPDTALRIASWSLRRARTPQPLRFARRLARLARVGVVPTSAVDH
jgi:deoxyribonuclease V